MTSRALLVLLTVAVSASAQSQAPADLIIHNARIYQDPSGNPPGGWTPGERMSREQALRSFTVDAAYAAHAETLTGSLEEGKLADLVVLSKDIMRVAPREILTTIVRTTVVGGEVVYEGKETP